MEKPKKYLSKDGLKEQHRKSINKILLANPRRDDAVEALAAYIVGKIGTVISYERKKHRLTTAMERKQNENDIESKN